MAFSVERCKEFKFNFESRVFLRKTLEHAACTSPESYQSVNLSALALDEQIWINQAVGSAAFEVHLSLMVVLSDSSDKYPCILLYKHFKLFGRQLTHLNLQD